MRILDKVNNWGEFWEKEIKGKFTDIEYSVFKLLLIQTFHDFFIEFQTPSRLMAHDEAENFCKMVRIKVGAYIPKPVILLPLLNAWKDSK